MEIPKSTLILASFIILGMGLFIGNKVNQQNKNSKHKVLRTTYILEMKYFIKDLKADVNEGRMDSSIANYYINNLGVIYDELIFYPKKKYIDWYENDSDTIHY